jgi:LacI family transcriptional regulator
MGHTRIAYLGPDTAFTTVAARIDGYRRALDSHGVAIDPELVFTTPTGVESRNLGYGAMRNLLDQGVESGSPRLPFTALFCYDDLVAAGAMAALRERGVSVPGDVSVVGYNDEPTALDVVPALTTVHISHIDHGRAALRLVLNHGNPQTVTLGDHISIATYLVIRDTVRRL